MPHAFQSSVPPLVVNIHVYDQDPTKRFVLINMKKYLEGDRIGNGPVLRHITPGGLQLEYQGQRYRILAAEG